VWVHGPGVVRLGQGVLLDGALAPIELKTFHGTSEIVIDDFAEIGPGTSIEAVVSVRVGARCRLGAFAKVMDNNFHALAGDRLARPATSLPVRLGEGARIGERAIVLAGAVVEPLGQVAPGSVLTRRTPVPPHRTARGVPAVIE
jgi:acetyltransferase-like isoleucine patch superfamily enzyme